MTTLAEVDRRVNEVMRMADDARIRYGENSIPHRNYLSELEYLRNIRGQMMNQGPIYGQPYNPTLGYQQPNIPAYAPQQPIAQQFTPSVPLATPMDSMGYNPIAISASSEVDNKFAFKVDDMNSKPKIEITYPVGNSSKVEESNSKSTPIEGNEFKLNVAHGLEAKREESNGSYKYEIYGSPLESTSISIKELDRDVNRLSNVKKIALEEKLDAMIIKYAKDIYGPVETHDAKRVNEILSSETVINALVNLNGMSSSVAEYIDYHYSKVLNNIIRYGMKKTWEMESILNDFDQLEGVLEKQPTKLRAYFNNALNFINKDMNKSINYMNNDKGVSKIGHSEHCVFVANEFFLGNINKLVDGQCISRDSNEPLFNMLDGIGSMYTKLITIDKVGEVTTYNVCLDIYGNYLISK